MKVSPTKLTAPCPWNFLRHAGDVWRRCLLAGVLLFPGTAVVACTSWVISPGISESGRMIVQKCRDNTNGRKLGADMRTSSDGRRWLRIGTVGDNALFAMNENGLVAVMNAGDPVTVKHPSKGRYWINSTVFIRKIMRDCPNAPQAVRLLLDMGKNRVIDTSSSLIIADPEQAFLVDIAPGYAEAKKIPGSVCVIANSWHLPGGEFISKKSAAGLCSDRAREANTRAALQKNRIKGKYTLRGNFNTSRLTCGKALKDKAPFRSNSLGGVCFEIDREYPACLSCAYIALGPQQHTVYLPVPMAAEQLPEEMRSGEWGQNAYDFRDAAGDDHPALGRIVEFEDKLISEFESVREEARRLLKDRKQDEAVKLLNDTFQRQTQDTWRFISELKNEAVKNMDGKSRKRAY